MTVKQLIAALKRLPPHARVDGVTSTTVRGPYSFSEAREVQTLHSIECVRSEGLNFGLLLGPPIGETTQHTTGAPPQEGRTGGVIEWRPGAIAHSDGIEQAGPASPRQHCLARWQRTPGDSLVQCTKIGGHAGRHVDANEISWGPDRPPCEDKTCSLGWDHFPPHAR